MQLQYLVFDISDEESGRGSFDAMASVVPERLPALLDEIATVLRWARETFGPAGTLQDEGEWGYDFQAIAEPNTPLEMTYLVSSGEVGVSPEANAAPRVNVTLTISGSASFCQMFCEAFEVFD